MRDIVFSLGILRVLGVLVCLAAPVQVHAAQAGTYTTSRGDKFIEQSALTPANVSQLTSAWTFRTGEFGEGFRRKGHSFQATPLLRDGRLFFATSANQLFAIDARTGEQQWTFDAQISRDYGYSEHAARGVAYWQDASVAQSAVCAKRIFLPTLLGEIYALDAPTGQRCTDFGDDGRIDLRRSALPGSSGVELEPGDYGITSPPLVFGDVLITGAAIGDNRGVELERGVVRGVDARTGRELWRWDPIPTDAADPASATWEAESSRRTGAANVWSPMTLDAERGVVYLSTSSPSPDFYGGERLGDNRYANSLVALEATTGALRWHQQLVHHDVWDYDLAGQPALATITHPQTGERVDAVLVATKSGMLYSFDRDTGTPIHGIQERAVPASDVPGERLSPTQPFSSLPALADQRALGPEDAFGVVWFDKRACADILASYRSEGVFTPPTLQGSILNPGWAGGTNWGGVAVDSAQEIVFANVNQLPGLVKLIPRDSAQQLYDAGELDGWDLARMQGTPYVMARRMFLSPLDLPCTQPPWGKLLAMDLRRGEILWERPLGTIEDLAPAFVPNFEWGVPNMGGPVVTDSGVLIIGAAADHYLRFFDTQTGALLHQIRLPAAAIATPMTYALDGETYVVVAVGGHSALGLKRYDAMMAWKLPAAGASD